MIKYIIIKNAERKDGIYSKTKDIAYEMQVTLSFFPDKTWKQYFYREWRKEFILLKKTVRVKENEVTLLLCSNDDIQSCIESVKQIIYKISNNFVDGKGKKGYGIKEKHTTETLKQIRKYKTIG